MHISASAILNQRKTHTTFVFTHGKDSLRVYVHEPVLRLNDDAIELITQNLHPVERGLPLAEELRQELDKAEPLLRQALNKFKDVETDPDKPKILQWSSKWNSDLTQGLELKDPNSFIEQQANLIGLLATIELTLPNFDLNRFSTVLNQALINVGLNSSGSLSITGFIAESLSFSLASPRQIVTTTLKTEDLPHLITNPNFLMGLASVGVY